MRDLSLRRSVATLASISLLVACDQQSPTDTSSHPSAPTDGLALQRSLPPPTEPKGDPNKLRLESLDARASYGIGYRMGVSVSQDESFQVNHAAILAGLRDGLERRTQRLSEAEMQSDGHALKERATTKAAEISGAKLADAKAFLERNTQRAGVQTTSSGLQYEILEAASNPEAPMPTPMDTVTVHYHGTLLDGRVFDSSIDRGEPISFAVRSVIPGWVEALQLMTVGEKRRLFIPPALGYGSKGAGSVPPNAVLLFDLELLGIESSPEASIETSSPTAPAGSS